MRGRLGRDAAAALGLAALVAAGAVLFLRGNPEVRVCRRIFTGLVKGEPAVRGLIDWEHLRALGADVGAAYTAQLANAEERQGYEEAFIKSFANGFRQAQASAKGFTNWRVQPDGSVAADYRAKGKTLIFRLSGAPKPRLQELAWRSP